jgi:hypothetical protein
MDAQIYVKWLTFYDVIIIIIKGYKAIVNNGFQHFFVYSIK